MNTDGVPGRWKELGDDERRLEERHTLDAIEMFSIS